MTQSGPSTANAPRLLVVGAGAVGGVLAANLLAVGHDVTILTRDPFVADGINCNGLALQGELGGTTIAGRAVSKLAPGLRFDFVLLAVRPADAEAAAQSVLQHLAPNGRVVSLQPPPVDAAVASVVGPRQTLGAVAAFSASMLEPAVYDRTGPGGLVLGCYPLATVASATTAASSEPPDEGDPHPTPLPAGADGVPTPEAPADANDGAASADTGANDEAPEPEPEQSPHEALRRLAPLLEAIGPVALTNNLAGARWSKLILSCTVASLGAIAGQRLEVLRRHPFARQLALEMITEAGEVAHAEGIELEKVPGTLDLAELALTDEELEASEPPASVEQKHQLLRALGWRYRRLRSPLLEAIEAGRSSAADKLTGELITLAEKHEMFAPITSAVHEEVLCIEARASVPSLATLRALYEDTRHSDADELDGSGSPADEAHAEPEADETSAPEDAPASAPDAADDTEPTTDGGVDAEDEAATPADEAASDAEGAADEARTEDTEPSPAAAPGDDEAVEDEPAKTS